MARPRAALAENRLAHELAALFERHFEAEVPVERLNQLGSFEKRVRSLVALLEIATGQTIAELSREHAQAMEDYGRGLLLGHRVYGDLAIQSDHSAEARIKEFFYFPSISIFDGYFAAC